MQKPNANREKIIELLEHAGGVTEESVREVHQQTGIAEADIWGTGLFYTLLREPGKRIRLCDGLTCQMFGADSLANELTDAGKMVERVSCLGQCDLAPASLDEEMELVTYAKHQTAISPPNEFAMNLAGEVDLTYSSLAKVREMAPEDVISTLESSGLQGRGGAGFPAHFKWTSVRQQAVTERYVICNADEAEPGTFKDRELILRQTHKMLEGLAIAAWVIEAKEIYIYIRGEYTNEYRAIERALGESKDALKEFEFTIVKGHGAYICGEETALLESLEGKRGMPRLKPPYPTESGFRGKPSLIHNVETIA
ncbi:NAD(P)H-dependent oxidoreductase subunit E, partial [Mariniblastus sp.]|nr:NAD(P)H-dependent oxidoreductase subunit E [Mariniblastus sp.]